MRQLILTQHLFRKGLLKSCKQVPKYFEPILRHMSLYKFDPYDTRFKFVAWVLRCKHPARGVSKLFPTSPFCYKESEMGMPSPMPMIREWWQSSYLKFAPETLWHRWILIRAHSESTCGHISNMFPLLVCIVPILFKTWTPFVCVCQHCGTLQECPELLLTSFVCY